jgi:hypothetical protein
MEYINKHSDLGPTAAIFANMNQQSSKNISCEVFKIQHEIYSASDWLGGSPENSWQIRTTNQKSGIEECEAPEYLLPLHPPMSCDLLHPKWEVINKESNFVSSFRPLCFVPIYPLLPLKLSAIYCNFRAVTNFTISRVPSLGDLD